jgi:CMP-N,N'-diacetyllegionaminic acid synthase
MTVLALIPARGGSKGVPRKNVRNLGGKPLIAWTIEAAQQARSVSRIVVSTEDSEIAAIARLYGAEVPFIRPIGLAKDETPGIDVVFHALENLGYFDDVLLLQPTSPLRTSQDIDEIFDLRRRTHAPSAVSVSAALHPPQWIYRIDDTGHLRSLLDEPAPARRQVADKVYVLNGALYCARLDWLLTQRGFISDEAVAYVMPTERSIDIDTPLDWLLAECLMTGRNHG